MTEPRSVDSHAGSNSLLSALAEEGNAVVWALDDAGSCVFAGHRWVQHTGLSEAASHGSGWHAAVHPVDLGALLESLFAAKEKRFLLTLRLLEDQRFAPFTVRATHTGEGWLVVAHRAPSENPEHLDAFGTDEYFRVCIETLLDCFGVFTAERDSAGKIIDFRIDYLNAAACRNNGSSLEDQVGRGLLERLPGHLESGLFDAYVGLVESGRPIDRVMQFYADDYGTGARQSRWFDIRAQKLGDGFAAAWRDVTEARGLLRDASRWNQATARLPGSDRIGQLAGLPTREALQARTDKLLVTLDAITDGVLTLDRNWRYTYFSEKGARAIGMRAEELIGACVWDVFPHAEGTSFYEGYHRAVRSREPVHFEEFYPAPLDKWLECHCYPDDDGLTVYFCDVTERRRAQAQLQRNHETFRRLVQTDPFGLYLIDADFRLAEVSLGAQKVFAGVRPLIGRDFDEVLRLIWPEPFVGEALAQFRRTLATGKPYRSPATVERRADIGETEAYDWRVERLTLPDGRFGVVCHFYDLSDRLRWEAALRESEERFRTMADALPLVVWVHDKDGKQEWVNQTFCELFGVTREEMRDGRWQLLTHPEDGAVYAEAFLAAVRAQAIFHAEVRAQNADGDWICMESWGRPRFNSDGAYIGHIGVSADITERKLIHEALRDSEEFNRTVLESSPDCLKVIAADGTVLSLNENGCSLLRLTDPTVLVGKKWWSFWPEESRALVQNAVVRASRGETVRFEREGPIATGEVKWWDVEVSPVRNPDGSVSRIVAVSRDITERKRGEDALRASEQRLELGVRVAGLALAVVDYATGLSHLSADSARQFGLGETAVAVPRERVHATFHPDDRALLMPRIAESLDPAGEGWFAMDHRIVWPSGEVRWLRVRKQVLFGGEASARRPVRAMLATLDITERLRIEEALREKDHFLQRITEVTPGVLQVFDLEERRAVFINRTVASLLGFSPGEVQAMGADVVPSLMHPDDLPRFAQHLARIATLADGEVADFEHRMRDRAGKWHWFHSHDAVFARDAAGGARQLIGVATEITERKRAEEAVARLAAIVESSHDALFGEDLDGIITSWNQGAEQIFGYRAEEIVGTSIMRLMPADRQAAENELQRQIVAGELGGTFEAIRLTKDGREFPASITVAPLKDAAGKVIGTSRVLRDITERARATEALRESQERIRLAAATTGVGIWEWNVITNVIRWDASMFRIYGIEPTPDGLVQYQDWSGSVLPEELAENEAILQDTVRRCGQSTREFCIRRRSDGECRWIQSVETVRANHEGKAEWVLGTNLDVTERLATAQALRDADRRKDEFLATLAHELRNPLAPVRTGLQVLKLTADKDIAHRTQLMMERQLGQMVRLIDDLLEVSRITSGKVVLRQERIELQVAVHTGIEAVRPQLDAARQELRLTLPSEPIWLHADATRICQVVNNLLTNASKYSPDDSRISLNLRLENGKAVVTVADEGEGIPQNMLASVFEMFAQVDRTLDRAQGGLGIGLALVKRLVEMHGGTVSVESAGLGAGSTFTVRLPVAANAEALGSNVAPLEEGDSNAKLRVLVVDDNADASETLAELLSIYGHETRVADSGASALAVVREFKPGLVFLDIGMPGMNGYETAKRIRADDPSGSITLVALTGWGAEADRIKGKEAGFDHHFTKPVEHDKVVRVLQLVALSQTKSASA